MPVRETTDDDVEGHKNIPVREAPDDDDVEGHRNVPGQRG
jgi:hypothetical protein